MGVGDVMVVISRVRVHHVIDLELIPDLLFRFPTTEPRSHHDRDGKLTVPTNLLFHGEINEVRGLVPATRQSNRIQIQPAGELKPSPTLPHPPASSPRALLT